MNCVHMIKFCYVGTVTSGYCFCQYAKIKLFILMVCNSNCYRIRPSDRQVLVILVQGGMYTDFIFHVDPLYWQWLCAAGHKGCVNWAEIWS